MQKSRMCARRVEYAVFKNQLRSGSFSAVFGQNFLQSLSKDEIFAKLTILEATVPKQNCIPNMISNFCDYSYVDFSQKFNFMTYRRSSILFPWL